MAEARAGVIAVGNQLRSDDGAGAAVLRLLRGRVAADVRLAQVLGEPSELLDAWAGLEHVVVVDAVRTGSAAGTIHSFDVSDRPLAARTANASTHGFGLAEALEFGRALGRLPRRVVVVGIEAGDDRRSGALSTAVEDALDDAAMLVLAELGPGGVDA